MTEELVKNSCSRVIFLSSVIYFPSVKTQDLSIYLGFFLYVKPSGKKKSGGNKNVHVGKIFFLNLVPKLVSHINKKTFLEKKLNSWFHTWKKMCFECLFVILFHTWKIFSFSPRVFTVFHLA